MILFSASTSTPLSQKSATFFRFAISAGPWTVRSWNFIPIPSAIRGTGFFSLTARSITNFPATTLPAFFICLASNPTRWKKVISSATDDDISRFSGDISFVGSLYTEKSPYDRLKKEPGYLTGYLEGIMAAQLKVYGYNFLEEILPDSIVEEFRNSLEGFYTPPTGFRRNDRATMAQLYLGAKVTAMERLWLMQTLGSKYSVNLYTASDTTGLSVHNCGLAKTLTEMPLIFHFSKINLNPTAKSIQTGLPLRLFDVLACEGFLLTNYQSELTDYFTPGQELECYTGEDDLLSKTEYYLTHENDRKEIAHNGYLALEKYHNYPERLLQMISLAYGLDAF